MALGVINCYLMPSPQTHYHNLKVAPNAPTEVIRAAYRALAQKHHPDLNPTADTARVMQLLNEAWAVLGDPKRRAEHDAWIAEQEGKSSHRDQTAPPPTGAGTTYTYTYTKPSHSWAKGTQRKAAPSPDVGQKRAASTASPIEQHSAEHRKSPHRNPLVRLNVWLGTANGRTYAIATVVGLVFIVWLLPGVVDRIERSKGSRSPPPQQQQSATPPPERLAEATASPPTSKGPSTYTEFTGKLDSPPPAPAHTGTSTGTPTPTSKTRTASRAGRESGGWGANEQQVSAVSRAGREQPSSGDAESLAVRWSPNGKPWPASAGYLKGMLVRASGGLSKLTIDNTNGGSDVYVKLCNYSPEKCDGLRHVFIPQGSSFTMNSVALGTYDIRYRSLKSGQMAKSESMAIRQAEEETGTRYSVMRLTLYTVHDGNTHFTPLSEEKF